MENEKNITAKSDEMAFRQDLLSLLCDLVEALEGIEEHLASLDDVASGRK